MYNEKEEVKFLVQRKMVNMKVSEIIEMAAESEGQRGGRLAM